MDSYRRKLEYKKLDEELEEVEGRHCGEEGIQRTEGIVVRAARLAEEAPLSERARHPAEGLLDSKLLLKSSCHVARLADTLSGNINQYDMEELAHHIKNNPEYWNNVTLPGRVAPMIYLHGTFLPGPPVERPHRQRQSIQPLTRQREVERPEDVSTVETNQEEASAALRSIKKFVVNEIKRTRRPIPFFPLVLHPTNFSTTIENIYHLSFLVRDGIIAFSIDDETKLPQISLVSKEQRERASSNQQAENNQFIVSLDMNQWKEAVDAFNIKEPKFKM